MEYIVDDLLNYETNKNKTVHIQSVVQSAFRVRYSGHIVEWIPEAILSQKFHTHIMSDSDHLRVYRYLNAKVLRINKQVCT